MKTTALVMVAVIALVGVASAATSSPSEEAVRPAARDESSPQSVAVRADVYVRTEACIEVGCLGEDTARRSDAFLTRGLESFDGGRLTLTWPAEVPNPLDIVYANVWEVDERGRLVERLVRESGDSPLVLYLPAHDEWGEGHRLWIDVEPTNILNRDLGRLVVAEGRDVSITGTIRAAS